MPRFYQSLFVCSLVLCSWYGMMAVHELGHVLGAVVTGGSVTRVVLHPLTISRTDVSPNPHPAIVVWCGPVLGSILPLCLVIAVGNRIPLCKIAGFFAGFCLVANGAYIGVGAWDRVGDCREMVRTGTPLWVMIGFGIVAISGGLLVWHRLGSLREFAKDPSLVKRQWALGVCLVLVVYLVVASLLSPN